MKHAGADTITVELGSRAHWLEVAVQDDGSGFDVVDVRNRPDAAFHFGLETLTERVRAGGGYARITSTAGTITRVSFALPIAGDPRPSRTNVTPERGGLSAAQLGVAWRGDGPVAPPERQDAITGACPRCGHELGRDNHGLLPSHPKQHDPADE